MNAITSSSPLNGREILTCWLCIGFYLWAGFTASFGAASDFSAQQIEPSHSEMMTLFVWSPIACLLWPLWFILLEKAWSLLPSRKK